MAEGPIKQESRLDLTKQAWPANLEQRKQLEFWDNKRLSDLNRLSEIKASLDYLENLPKEQRNKELVAEYREEKKRLANQLQETVNRLKGLGAEWV